MAHSYIEFSDTDYTELQKKLLRTKGSDDQRHFLEVVRDESSLLSYLHDNLSETGTKKVPLLPEPLTENEYKVPPADTEQRLYRAWGCADA